MNGFKPMSGCSLWFLDYLWEHGPTLVGAVKQAAKAKGYTRGELKKARKESGIKTFHSRDADAWYWHLPSQKVGAQR